jgi:hypothetical protein
VQMRREETKALVKGNAGMPEDLRGDRVEY